jgi:hypothetical protein
MSQIPRIRSILVTALLLQGCAGIHPRQVVAIARTNTYHREFCAPVHMAKTKVMSPEDARLLGMRACTVCKPDQI